MGNALCDLVAHLKGKLADSASFNNPALTRAANKIFGGSRGGGHYSPRDAYDALEAAANQYLLEERAVELMRSPVADALTELRQFTARLATQSDRTKEQVEFQQFSTPPPLGYVAARLLSAQPGEIIVEPSAGTAGLAIWLRAIGATVICNEIAPRRIELLKLLGFETHTVNAEFLDDLLPQTIRPSGIIMNPPFSATGGRVAKHDPKYGARHVETALRRLEKGGRLVAITGAGMAGAEFNEWWRRIVRMYNVRASVGVGGKEFAKSGTNVDSLLTVIDKDGATPGRDWKEQIENIERGYHESLEDAWEELKGLTAREPREEKAEEDTPVEVFVPYQVQRIIGGQPHPAVVVESSSMAAVAPPVITYKPVLSRHVLTDGALSDIQMERVIYAGQRHEQRLPNGARGGFFVGDGTGVGKGRVLAAIIADNWNQGKQRAVWFSVNNDLMDAAKRDLTDIGMGHITLARINDYGTADEITLPAGIIFSSYSSLIAQSREGAKRIDQIQRWLGREPVIIFDEAHRAKNALAAGKAEPTQTGQAVIDLQSAERNPDYRVIYSSATGATDVRNMAYMTRLGLWGPGTSFGSFNHFLNEIEAGGVGAKEMVSRDMKALGMYLSGSISFGVCPESGKAVEYVEVVHRMTPQQREMYNAAAAAWRHVQKEIDEALKVTNGGTRQRSNALNKFWGDHQRFFRQILCAIKVPTILKEAERYLADDHSVVISLIGTGEARTRDLVGRALADGALLEDLDFTPREVIAQMIERGFPTAQYEEVDDPKTGNTIKVLLRDSDDNIVHSQEALRLKQALLDGLSALHLPENPLDQIVNHFGEDEVAELTGRTRRIIRDKATGEVKYKRRAPDGVAMHRANVYQMAEFQAGRKRVAIISDAASMGISLHASNREANKQRRAHLTLELGWSADKQMQTFGRTHRSDQAVPPIYGLVPTDAGGEKRFCSTIAKRLGSLGALTKGDRNAASSGDLAKYNFETIEGRSALSFLFRSIMKGEDVLGLDNPKQTLRDMGLLQKDDTVRKEDEENVTRFLNRVLALDLDQQNAIFDQFASVFERTVLAAKASGNFDEGVSDIRAVAARLATQPKIVATDPITGATTRHYVLDVDRRTDTIPFDEAEVRRRNNKGVYMRNISRGFVVLALPGRYTTDADTGATYRTFYNMRPDGKREYKAEQEMNQRYQPIPVDEAKEAWNTRYAEVPAIETTKTHIIGGAILPLWQRLKTEKGARLRVVRVTTEDGRRVVGAQIDPSRVGPTLRALGLSRNLKSPEEIFRAVWVEGDIIQLVEGLVIKRAKLHREDRIEVCNPQYYHYQTLRGYSLIEERIAHRVHFYISTEESEGVDQLEAVIRSYPLAKTKAEEDQEEDEPLEFESEQDVAPINLASWILPVPGEEPEPAPEPPPPIEPTVFGFREGASQGALFDITPTQPRLRRKLAKAS